MLAEAFVLATDLTSTRYFTLALRISDRVDREAVLGANDRAVMRLVEADAAGLAW